MLPPLLSHTSSPVGAGGGHLITPGESAEIHQSALLNFDAGFLDSIKNNSRKAPDELIDEIANRWVLIHTKEEINALEPPVRRSKVARMAESLYVPGNIRDAPNEKLQNYIKQKFTEYLDHVKGKDLIFRHRQRDIKGNTKYLAIPYTTRFTGRYRNNVKTHIDILITKRAGQPCVLLTLTVDPKLYDWDMGVMWTTIKKEFNRFLTTIFGIIGHRIEYLCVPEAQPTSGLPHLHVVFFEASRLLDWRQLKKHWKIGRINVKPPKQSTHAIRYVTKYITKTFTATDSANVLSQSCLWYYEVDSFTHSLGLMPSLSKKVKHQWSLVATMWCLYPGSREWIKNHLEVFDALLEDHG